MKLNGWRRLWVVAVALWTIPVGVFAFQNWPTVARMTARHELSLSADGSGRFAILDRGLTVGIYDNADELKVAWYWIILRRQAVVAGRAFGLWIVPAIAFYALWWTIELGPHYRLPRKR
jgi:hypothetical protein